LAPAFLEKVKFETEWWTEVVKENDIKVEGCGNI
jgi:hypothetical protein